MRNEQLQRVADVFVGDWAVSITNQRWIEDKTATTTGTAKGEWLGDAFVQRMFGHQDAAIANLERLLTEAATPTPA